MSTYVNKVDITSGRRLHVASPMDDRVVFTDVANIQADIIADRPAAWFMGLCAYIVDKHAWYVWLDANAANPNVPYNQALLSNDFYYGAAYPDPVYQNKYYNWYPIPGAGSGGGYFNTEPTSATNLEGWPAGTIPGGIHQMQYMWDKLLYPYVPPQISLVGIVSPGYYEKGVIISQVQLDATTVKKKLDITSVEYFRDGALIHTNNTPNPNGGVVTYVDLVDVGPQLDVEFQATVGDGQSTVLSNKINYRFVYPFYIGETADAQPTEATVKAMTKLVTPKKNQQYLFNFSQKRYVIAYPQAYGLLDHIYDTNRFETIDDYTINTGNYTMLDGAVVPYYIYVFNFLTDAVDFINYFEF